MSTITARRPTWFFPLLAALVLATSACSGDDDSGGDGDQSGGTGTGNVAVSVEPVEGFFTEGFEIGIRFETGTGERIATAIWSDAVVASGNTAPDAVYTHVLEQQVPAGDVVVLATVNVGIGPPPEVPDVDGELRCQLDISVADGATVQVQAGFGESCLEEIG